MEELKKVKMENASNKDNAPKKLTYEQLNDACNQLWQQNKQLVLKNKELEQFIINKRFDYLFKVIEHKEVFSSEFVKDCTKEIEDAINSTQEAKED